MLRGKAEEEIKKIPLSNNTICRRICDMSADIENTVITSVKKSKIFAMQVHESTDMGGKAQLLAFMWYVNNEKITEQFFCCKELTETTKGQDIFDTLNKYILETVCRNLYGWSSIDGWVNKRICIVSKTGK